MTYGCELFGLVVRHKLEIIQRSYFKWVFGLAKWTKERRGRPTNGWLGFVYRMRKEGVRAGERIEAAGYVLRLNHLVKCKGGRESAEILLDESGVWATELELLNEWRDKNVSN